ncbi:unnamed protein product [Dibothriocephalus latus]|uniref:Chaperone DnaJ C-terminal domain-containing protein n=1 Tax=Dibothriocephalus latus TaxID=60516 RepID=A0A3P7KW10_DIBLA|nr:unnamed protein product [Dibothriocephalus latus]
MLRVSVGDARRSPQELFVTVRVESSRLFRRDGADIHSDITVSLAQAALGGKIRVPGIYEQVLVTNNLPLVIDDVDKLFCMTSRAAGVAQNGTVFLVSKEFLDDQYCHQHWRIPAGSSSRDRIRLPGKGISRVNGRGYGDHYIHINIETPKRLTELQRALLLAFAETEAEIKGSVDGVASTESALSNLHRTLVRLTSNGQSSQERSFSSTSSKPNESSPGAEVPKGGYSTAEEGDSGRRAIDNTQGFLLSRIRAATGTSPVSNSPQSKATSESPEASSEFLRKRKTSE